MIIAAAHLFSVWGLTTFTYKCAKCPHHFGFSIRRYIPNLSGCSLDTTTNLLGLLEDIKLMSQSTLSFCPLVYEPKQYINVITLYSTPLDVVPGLADAKPSAKYTPVSICMECISRHPLDAFHTCQHCLSTYRSG